MKMIFFGLWWCHFVNLFYVCSPRSFSGQCNRVWWLIVNCPQLTKCQLNERQTWGVAWGWTLPWSLLQYFIFRSFTPAFYDDIDHCGNICVWNHQYFLIFSVYVPRPVIDPFIHITTRIKIKQTSAHCCSDLALLVFAWFVSLLVNL